MPIDYREFPSPQSLEASVQCLWWLHDKSPAGSIQTVYPDGRCELIIHLARPMRSCELSGQWRVQAQNLFAAQQRQAIRLRADGEIACLGVRLQPAASPVVAGLRVEKMRDRIIDLTILDAGFAKNLAQAAARFRDTSSPDVIWATLLDRFGSYTPDTRIAATVSRIDAAHGLTGVDSLAAAAGMARRTLQLRFLKAVGLSLREYARLQRLQTAIRLLDQVPVTLSLLALDAGFSDQPHATRELRRLTGLTPARLAHALHESRNDDGTIRLAAAFVRGRST